MSCRGRDVDGDSGSDVFQSQRGPFDPHTDAILHWFVKTSKMSLLGILTGEEEQMRIEGDVAVFFVTLQNVANQAQLQ